MTDTVTKSVEAHRKRVTGGIFRNSSAMGILDGRQRQLMKMKVTTVLDVGSSCSSSTMTCPPRAHGASTINSTFNALHDNANAILLMRPPCTNATSRCSFYFIATKIRFTKCFDVATAMLRGVLVAVNTITSSVRIHARQILVLPLLFEPGH